MVVVLGSIMRDAVPYLNRYMAQVAALRSVLSAGGHTLTHVVTEGDSQDCTWQALSHYSGPGFVRLKFDHGGEKFGSVNHPTRWQNIARTWNHMLDRIQGWEFDAFIYVESDLLWAIWTMVGLLDRLQQVPAVAPMSMMGSMFYDTWGHRAMGEHFQNAPPFHAALPHVPHGHLMQLDSAGSCKVMRAEVAKRCRLAEHDAMMGHDIYAKGYSLWLDPSLRVDHP